MFTDQDIISAYLSLAENSPIYRNIRENNNVGMNVYILSKLRHCHNGWEFIGTTILVKFLNGRLGHDFK